MGRVDKDVVRAYYETNDITLKELADKFDIAYNTIKSWKSRDKKDGCDWGQLDATKNEKVATKDIKKVAKLQNKKQALKQAKSLVISGATLKEASDKTQLKEDTLRGYSAKEKWMESRKEYQNHLYKELLKKQGESHIKECEKSYQMIVKIRDKSFGKLEKGELNVNQIKIYKDLTDMIAKGVSAQSKILGIKDIDKIELDESEETNADDVLEIKVIK